MIFLYRNSGTPCTAREIRNRMLVQPEIREIISSSRKIAIFVDGSWGNSVVYETALALVELCREMGLDDKLIYLEPYGSLNLPDGARFRIAKVNPFSYEHFNVRSNILTSTLGLSRFWLGNISLIIICEPVVHRQLGLSSILLAQAKLLFPYRGLKRLYVKELIYKAHELLRCDLGIVCGHTRKGQAESEAFWCVSSSDLVLEKEIAGACNVRYEELPHIKFCSSHVYVDESASKTEGPPLLLEGYAENYPPNLPYVALTGAMRVTASAIESTLVSAYNLRKAPGYILKKMGRE